MLDRLETELIDHILDAADQDWSSGPRNTPPVPRPTKSCSLVCRRLRQVAQPMLWRVIALDKKGDFEVVKRVVAAGELGQHVRVLEASGWEAKGTEFGALVESLPGLADVRLRDFSATALDELDDLLPLRHIRHLKLSSVLCSNIATPSPFNNLSSLSLQNVYVRKRFLAGLLQPQNLPVLRSLHLSNLSADEDETTFLPSINDTLFSQLEILQLSLRNLHLAELEVIQHHTTLFSGTIHDLREYLFEGTRPAAIKNLHVRPAGLHEALLRSDTAATRWVRHYTCATVGKLVAFIPYSNIATLLLPLHLRQPALTAECDELLAACSVKGIEVLWEDASSTDKEDEEEEGFREEFRRWMVKKKRVAAEKRDWTV